MFGTFPAQYRFVLFSVVGLCLLWAFWTMVNAPLSLSTEYSSIHSKIYATELDSHGNSSSSAMRIVARFRENERMARTIKEENRKLKLEIDTLKRKLQTSTSSSSSSSSSPSSSDSSKVACPASPAVFAPVTLPPAQCQSASGPLLPIQYLFTPRPQAANIFLTVTTDPGGGLGHQLVEFLWAPWLAQKLNVSYLHTRFVGHSAVWNRWLMFGEDEPEEEDLKHVYERVVVKYAPYAKPTREQKLKAMKWLSDEIAAIRSAPASTTATTAYVFSMKQWTLHHPVDACWPPFNRLLRQKYCAARIRRPVLPQIDYFAMDEHIEAEARAFNRSHGLAVDSRPVVRVSIHFRAGNNAFRDTGARKPTFAAVLRFINISNVILTQEFHVKPVYYFITQSPDNMTADAFFEKFFADPIVQGVELRRMIDISSRMSFHLMALSHIHMGSKSGFSQVPQFFRRGLTVSPFPACIHSLFFNHFTGEFDDVAFRREFRNQVDRFGLERERLETWEECANIQEFPPVPNFDFDRILPNKV